MGYENGRTHGSAASCREYEQRKRARMQQIASDPQARLAYEEHRRRRMVQIMSDPQARREYERRRAQRAHERRMRRVRMIAALVLTARLSDGVLMLLNQLLKALAVVLGVRAAVERGGNRGFFTGMTVALAYMIAGYGLYVALGGGRFEAAQMLGEMLLGAAVGGAAGAVRVNLKPKARRAAARA